MTFSNKISRKLSKSDRKFTADMLYGMLASGSCLLTDIVDQRVRKLRAINALNFYITLCMAFLAHLSIKPETNALKISIIKMAAP